MPREFWVSNISATRDTRFNCYNLAVSQPANLAVLGRVRHKLRKHTQDGLGLTARFNMGKLRTLTVNVVGRRLNRVDDRETVHCV